MEKHSTIDSECLKMRNEKGMSEEDGGVYSCHAWP